MSEAPETGETDDIDLTGVPMDGEPEGGAAAAEGEAEGAAKKPAGEAGDKAPLAPEELEKRYANSRTALAEERRARRDLERRLEALESGGGRAAPAGERQPAREEAEIDPDVDPVGALKQMRAKVQAYEQAERIESQTQAQRDAREAQFAKVERALSEHEADFKEDHPDYDDAAKHYAVTRAQELMQFGLQPQQIQGMLREEFATLAATAIQARKNPAAVVYEMAKGRGYGKQADADPKGGKGAEQGKGKLDAISRGQRATSPLGRSGGRGNTALDAETVGNISIRSKAGRDAFEKAFDAMERQAKAAERGR